MDVSASSLITSSESSSVVLDERIQGYLKPQSRLSQPTTVRSWVLNFIEGKNPSVDMLSQAWPALHWSFQGERILLPFIVLGSPADFFIASLMIILICASERFLTFAYDAHWEPHSLRLSRRWLAFWRTWIYTMITSLRICCLLVLTTFHLGIITVIILTLSTAQFFIELENLPKPPRFQCFPSHQSFRSRPRSKSKPDEIFLHPTESNIARADAAALELGIGGDTERVTSHWCNKEESAWRAGTGRDEVRALLAVRPKLSQLSTTSECEPFLNPKNVDEAEYSAHSP